MKDPTWEVTVNFYVRAKTREDAWGAAREFAMHPGAQNRNAIDIVRVSMEAQDSDNLTIDDIES